jgi:nucleoside-diphosphate-sugar epimerase
MEAIVLRGAHRLYNIGSGVQTTNVEVAELLTRCVGADVSFAADAPAVIFPPIDVHRLRDEFGLAARPFATSLLRLVEESRLSQALT